MKKNILWMIIFTMFVLGFVGGHTQRQSIITYEKSLRILDNSGILIDSYINSDEYITGGFKNIRKTFIMSKKHLIYLAKRELSKDEINYYTYPHIRFNKDDEIFEVLFDVEARKDDLLYFGQPTPCVYIDKRGVTVMKIEGTKWWNF